MKVEPGSVFASNVAPRRRVLPARQRQPWTCKCGVEQHPGLRRCGSCGEGRP